MAKGSEKAAAPKRGRGRPMAAEGVTGRETLIAAARELLNEVSPGKLTIATIARKAGSDPGLVRYYFGDREALLLAVVEDMLQPTAPPPPPTASPDERLQYRIRNMVDFARQARTMQRLVIDELAVAKSPEIRQRVVAIYARAVERYAGIFDQTLEKPLRPVDPLFMFVSLIGVSEFFAAAQPLIKPLRPAGESEDQLFERYKDFVTGMLLDGLRPR